jgi:Peptidase A4 family
MSGRSARKIRGDFRRAALLGGLIAVITAVFLGGALGAPGRAATAPAAPGTTTATAAGVVRPEAPTTPITNPTWSGYVQTGSPGSYRSVSASWTVPALTPSGSTHSSVSQWIGIDGWNGDPDLIQAGTVEMWNGDTKSWFFRAWSENLPGQKSEVDAFNVSTGDDIYAQIRQEPDSTWWIYLLDRTNGGTISLKGQNYAGPLSSAEFVQENPIGQMAVMTPATFRNARVNYEGARLTAGQRVALVKYGKQISTPSLPNPEGNGFTVADGPADPTNLTTEVFERHGDGSVWAHTGPLCIPQGCPDWTLIDNNPAAVSISAGAGTVYQLHGDKSIWEWIGGACVNASFCPGWIELDNNPDTVAIYAGNGTVYQVRGDGSILEATGEICLSTPCAGWVLIDDNPASSGSQLAPGAGTVFQLDKDGSVWKYTGAPCAGIVGCLGWAEIDDNPGAAIEAGLVTVYERRRNGAIYRYNSGACNGADCYDMQEMDDNPASIGIAAGGYSLYQLHDDGTIYVSNGQPCTPFITSCPGWNQLPGSAPVSAMAAGEVGVYRMDSDGFIWISIGGTWSEVDNDPLTAQVSVSNGT